MFIRSVFISIAAFFFICPARGQPDPDVIFKLEAACERVLAGARKGLKENPTPTESTVLEEDLEVAQVLSILEKQYGYTKKYDQRKYLDNPVLKCRLTEPGVKLEDGKGDPAIATCERSEPTEPKKNHVHENYVYGYSDDVLFSKDKPAQKIRKALLDLFAYAGQPQKTRSKRRTTFKVTGAMQSPSGKLSKADEFVAQSQKIKIYIDGKPAIKFSCVGPTIVKPHDNMVDIAVLSAADDVYVGFTNLLDATVSTVLPTYERRVLSAEDIEANKLIKSDDAEKDSGEPKCIEGDDAEKDSGEPKCIKSDDAEKNSEEPKFARAFKIVKNPQSFAKDDPDGVALGTTINADGSSSEFSVDAALGLTFSAIDHSAKCTAPFGTCALVGDPNGSKRQYSFYVAYAQAASTEKVFDKSQFAFPLDPAGVVPTPAELIARQDGRFVVMKRAFADGVLRAGVRVDYESRLWFEKPGDKKKWWQNTPGKRPLGSKSSLTLETLTDNQFDLQANRFEATWTPPTAALFNIEGYRRPVGIFGGKSGPKFQWTFNTNIDGTSYARTPQIRDVTNPLERRDLPDFIRIGVDAEAELIGRLPEALFGRGGKWGLGYKWMHRESLAGKAADAFGNEVSLSFEDVWWTKGKFSLTYINEENAITLNERELYKLGVEFKLR